MIPPRIVPFVLFALFVSLASCDQLSERAQEAREVHRQGAATSQDQARPPLPSEEELAARSKPEDVPLPEIAASGFLYRPTPKADAERLGGVNEEVAASRVVAYVRDAAELGPTLVVWIFDRSHSASKIVYQSSRQVNQFYTDIAKGRVPKIRPRDEAPRLLTAVVTFGADVQYPLGEPTAKPQAVIDALDAIPVDSTAREMTFAAVAGALEKYLRHRTEQGRNLVLVVVTDEAGDDAQRVEDVLAAPRKFGVPIYVIGAPAPFGRVSALPQQREGDAGAGAAGQASSGARSERDTPDLRHGPESLHLERVNVPSFAGFWRNEVLESGFGPFALERLCRATGGEFILLQPPPEREPGAAVVDWPSSLAVRFDKEAMRRYAPDYVSPQVYQQLLDENGARVALHRAAALEDLPGDFHPEIEFPRETEAQLLRRVNQAQQTAASLAPQIDRVYELLQQGEADRAKLTEPRWQAAFDLAMGRAAAAKARIDGYNAMLAILKRGRRFERDESTRWLLQPSDTTEAGSAIERLIQKARINLERVVADHPGTPWAYLAQQELEAKFGWQWTEQ